MRVIYFRNSLRFVLIVIGRPLTILTLLFSTLAICHSSIARAESDLWPPVRFEVASPTTGLWKGCAVGTSVTKKQTIADVDSRSVTYFHLIVVGKSELGDAFVAIYQASNEAGPWRFVQTKRYELRGFLHEPGIDRIREQSDKLRVGGQSIDCVVRSYAGNRAKTLWHERIEGDEWTIGADGPALQSKLSLTAEFDGGEIDDVETRSCVGIESIKVGEKAISAYHTIVENRAHEALSGGRSHEYVSDAVPGWTVLERAWNQPDETQAPIIERQVISFGPDAKLLEQYVKTDRPPEIERAKLLATLPRTIQPTSRPTSAPVR